MNRQFCLTHTVRYDECNCDGVLTPAAFLRYMQEIAAQDAEDAHLEGEGYWVIKRTVMSFATPIPIHTRLELKTFGIGFTRITAQRGYEAHLASSPQAEPLASARTLWVYVDSHGRPVRQMGQQMELHFSGFHQVLNRARWSPLAVSRRLLQVLVSAFVRAGGTLEIVMDETLERRWGRKISKRGHWRDSLRSSKERSVSTSGLRWVSMALVVSLPWTNLRWALPFLSVLASTPKVS